MSYIFPPIATPSVPVASGRDSYAVRRIFCVGRNYGEHVKEMGGDPQRNPPFFFSKPADAIVHSGSTVPYPTLTKNFHHEIELVVAIGRTCFRVSTAQANDFIYGYAVGIDLTRRDLQMDAMKKGHPWDIGKSFDRSAPCGSIHPASETGVITNAHIWLKVNGETKQDSSTSELIWSVPEIISILSEAFELQPGDLIYTGTPAGVGSLVAGDRITGGIDGLGEISINIGPAL